MSEMERRAPGISPSQQRSRELVDPFEMTDEEWERRDAAQEAAAREQEELRRACLEEHPEKLATERPALDMIHTTPPSPTIESREPPRESEEIFMTTDEERDLFNAEEEAFAREQEALRFAYMDGHPEEFAREHSAPEMIHTTCPSPTIESHEHLRKLGEPLVVTDEDCGH